MANQAHVKRLRKNITGWNRWRDVHPETRPDLSEADLLKADLLKADLFRANLNRANLIGAHLSDASLSEADLFRADLFKADLLRADLNRANLSDANLNRANLSGANLNRARLNRAHLSDAHLSGADLFKADLSGADLLRAHLNGTNLSGAHLSGAYLSGADLSDANLNGADLSDANLNGTNLSRTNLNGTNLSRTNLNGAKIWGTIFGDCDLQTVKGLETVIHLGPSHLTISTIYKSKGNIPEIFLKRIGAPDIFIEYIKTLTKPIEYYTCFISYSSKNQEFAKRLYTDLQANNVRCWFYPEDMKTGDQIWQRIDDSIHIYDKLLLILSSESVISQGIEKEVTTALRKEREGKRVILFPVRIDEMVMYAVTPWIAYLRDTRHIGDFTQWKDYDAYQKGLQRLLRDLKQGE